MGRYVDADKLMQQFKEAEDKYLGDYLDGVEECKMILNNAPTIEGNSYVEGYQDAIRICKVTREIQTGKWIFKQVDEDTGIKQHYWCSICNRPQAQMGVNYCAYCGAEMENTDI